ncbi:MAG TPA: orotate phosphoribosyltransferase-like protein [Methanoregulaceae archaeon]|jgi:orotate phosphoribosyltransferase|nr:orotate phosphoribosyltransferase-like protein [Methanolinea sp.]MDD3090220.1 orotate phosphoribosyltransferase-like protein [Methanoregulaceae archaeon]MDD5047656.1 orotate phosphoribosyltransferase-like protein [Methanoregulaceae archaeon]MDD5685210.1 orotate phosphoribosyltransferase-like protein [Methanoregulaceae archaeon]HOP67120.1 orotate phosphoribosyltransferase-like protein [Methanoregulaceae archaeon]
MSSLDDLIQKAQMLLSEGHSPGQIADELSLSMETVTWLLTQQKGMEIPKDVHIDWTAVSGHAPLLDEIAMMMLKRYYIALDEKDETSPEKFPTVIVGIAISGIPLATLIAVEEDVKIAIYHPAKHSTQDPPVGSVSGNFATIAGERCIIVDDVITSGNTMHEVVRYLRRHGSVPVAVWVMFDKRGLRDVDGVPVFSLFQISRID